MYVRQDGRRVAGSRGGGQRLTGERCGASGKGKEASTAKPLGVLRWFWLVWDQLTFLPPFLAYRPLYTLTHPCPCLPACLTICFLLLCV